MVGTDNVWRDATPKLQQKLAHRAAGYLTTVGNLEAFQASIQQLCVSYSRTNVSVLVREKLVPHMQHLASFEKAISLSAQNATPSALLWSATLAVIECACRFSVHLDRILDTLADFYRLLPRFNEYMILFPGNYRLQYPLHDLFEDYSDLCLHAIKWTERNPAIHIIKSLFSSGAEHQLKSIMNSMKKHVNDFDEEAKLAFRQHQMRANPPSPLPSSSSQNPNLEKSHYMVTQRKNLNFRGRTEVLADIYKSLHAPKSKVNSEALSYLLHGLSGVGKTSTALEYTYRYRDSYDYIFWLVVETKSDIVRSFAQLVAKLRSLNLIPDANTVGGTADAETDLARDWLESTDEKWLFVLDNVEEWSSIMRYWPTSAKAQSAILVTAQNQEFRRETTYHLLLSDLSIEESSDLLMSHIEQTSVDYTQELDASKKIANLFGGLPLAIAHIQGYVNDARCKLCDFLELAESRYPSLWECDVIVSNHKRLEVVWDFALEELPRNAKDHVYEMAFLDPDSIPAAVFLQEESGDRVDMRLNKAEFIEMARCLVRRALVRPVAEVQDCYLIHRAVQQAILHKLDKDEAQRERIFTKAMHSIRKITPEASSIQVPNPGLWTQFERAVPQILARRAAFVRSQPPIRGSVELAKLLYDAAFNTWERESSQDGLKLLETALSVLGEVSYDENGPLRADIHVMFGTICDNIGISKRAEALHHRKIVVRIREHVINQSQGPVKESDDILLHNGLNDTAESHLQYYNYAKAEELVEKCLQRYKTWGEEHKYPFEYGKYYRNKAHILVLQRHFDQAIAHARRSVELAHEDSGPGPRYLQYRQDLASHLLQAGDVQGAFSEHREIYKLREKICGKFHDTTLQSIYAIGAMHYHMGDLREAEKWLRLVLERAKRHRWPDEPLCRAQYHLAQVIRLQFSTRNSDGRSEEADILAGEAEKVLNKLLNHDHLDRLKMAQDRLTFYDHLQPAFRGRWTGRDLLRCLE